MLRSGNNDFDVQLIAQNLSDEVEHTVEQNSLLRDSVYQCDFYRWV